LVSVPVTVTKLMTCWYLGIAGRV